MIEEKYQTVLNVVDKPAVPSDIDKFSGKDDPGRDFEEKEKFLKSEKYAGDESVNSMFDSLMEEIGTAGKFQKRFDILYNFVLQILVSMTYMNMLMVMVVPNHWCYVPGREMTNLTVDEWKAAHIPTNATILDNDGFSSCTMYQVTDEGFHNDNIVECTNGWEYDRKWYTETVPSLNNWVCDREVLSSNILAASRGGEAIGNVILGHLGDAHGRRSVYYISMILITIGRLMLVVTSHMYYVFMIMVFIGGFATNGTFQATLMISMEVADPLRRSQVAFLQVAGLTTGFAILPFISWGLKDWKWIIIVTTLPSVFYLFTYKLLPESPRWLASKGKLKEGKKTLEYIAKVNGTRCPDNTYEVLENIKNRKEKFYGIPSLFLYSRLAKNTILLNLCWCFSGLSYFILTLNITTMDGNPFLNFFWQFIVELPGSILGRFFCNLIGRRWTHAGSYIIAAVLSVVIIITFPLKIPYLETTLLSILKLFLTSAFYTVWLQAMEIYPTCVRQTGTSLGGLTVHLGGILGPYLMLLGTTIHQSIPYAVTFVCMIIAFVCASFLPETHLENLPETLKDAQNFGRKQKYWSFKIYRNKNSK